MRRRFVHRSANLFKQGRVGTPQAQNILSLLSTYWGLTPDRLLTTSAALTPSSEVHFFATEETSYTLRIFRPSPADAQRAELLKVPAAAAKVVGVPRVVPAIDGAPLASIAPSADTSARGDARGSAPAQALLSEDPSGLPLSALFDSSEGSAPAGLLRSNVWHVAGDAAARVARSLQKVPKGKLLEARPLGHDAGEFFVTALCGSSSSSASARFAAAACNHYFDVSGDQLAASTTSSALRGPYAPLTRVRKEVHGMDVPASVCHGALDFRSLIVPSYAASAVHAVRDWHAVRVAHPSTDIASVVASAACHALAAGLDAVMAAVETLAAAHATAPELCDPAVILPYVRLLLAMGTVGAGSEAALRCLSGVSTRTFEVYLAAAAKDLRHTARGALRDVRPLGGGADRAVPSHGSSAPHIASLTEVELRHEAPIVHSPTVGELREDVHTRRKLHSPSNLQLHYNRPEKLVRGVGQMVCNEHGRWYLDACNNVIHVGHAHPRVARAISEQAAQLSVNSRYLSDVMTEALERIASTFPSHLNKVFMVSSGSEANDLALRLARIATSNSDFIALRGAYHGNTASTYEISSYKFDRPSATAHVPSLPPPHVHVASAPDLYRGPFSGQSCGDAIASYVKDVQRCVDAAQQRRAEAPSGSGVGGVAAFICESLMSCGGQIPIPPAYAREVYRAVRAAGGVCIADEVQVGFGRVGSAFWAFERFAEGRDADTDRAACFPDIVTIGKPMGNGFPVAAVVTTEAIAEAFAASGVEFFSTYGANPVAAAASLAVLDTLAVENRTAHAARVGAYLEAQARTLASLHPQLIGDVRGVGLLCGIELVDGEERFKNAAEQLARTERGAAQHAAEYAASLSGSLMNPRALPVLPRTVAGGVGEAMRERGVLLTVDGLYGNVLKIKPPMCFCEEDVDYLMDALDKVLKSLV